MTEPRIGLTMRLATAPGHGERRDALSREWPAYMAAVLPEAAWMPLPNLGPDIVSHAARWGLTGFVLTGGDSPGEDPERDATEQALLWLALDKGFPVLGVCRGFQMLQRHFGGELVPVEGHVATRHPVIPHGEEVNSFHSLGIERLAAPLTPLARCPGGFVEAAAHAEARLLGLMWHPEREPAPRRSDTALVRGLFGLEAACA